SSTSGRIASNVRAWRARPEGVPAAAPLVLGGSRRSIEADGTTPAGCARFVPGRKGRREAGIRSGRSGWSVPEIEGAEAGLVVLGLGRMVGSGSRGREP